jgi:hypothetical protein
MPFPSRIRGRGDFPWWCLELELGLCFIIAERMEGVGRAGAGHVLALLASLGRDVVCAQGGSWVGLGRAKNEIRGGERRGRLGRTQIPTGFLFFFKSFYNLQTNLNSKLI